MEVRIESNALAVYESIPREAAQVRERCQRVVMVHGVLLQGAVKRNANMPRTTPRPGPGGPRLLTGNYNRSIHRRTVKLLGSTRADVGTNAPQGPRLEYGFHGEDSLGRHYEQQAYPHFAPALDQVAPAFMAAAADATSKDPTP